MSNFIQNFKKITKEAKNRVEDRIQLLSVDDATRTERLDICNQCEYLISLTNQCSKCGCFVKAKTWLSTASCPLKKW